MVCAWTTSSQQILAFGLYNVQLLKTDRTACQKLKARRLSQYKEIRILALSTKSLNFGIPGLVFLMVTGVA